MRKPYLSPSKLKRFRACPFQCKYEDYKSNPATDFGNSVHKGLAAFYRDNDFLKAYRAEASELGVPMSKEETALSCFEYSKSLNINKEAIITVESADGEVSYFGNKYAQVDINDDFGLLGGMDLVYAADDGGLVIRDHKTGMSKEEDELQLTIYALIAWKKYGSFPYIKTVFDYLQQNFSEVKYWDAESLVIGLEYLMPLAKKYLEALKTNNWPRTPHKNCNYCSLKNGCEAFNKQLMASPYRPSYDIEAKVENLPTILEYHNKISAICKAAYGIEKMMKEKYVEVLSQGPVSIDGRTFKLKEKICRYNYDLPTIFNKTSEIIGRTPLELCEYSSSGAKLIEKELDKENKKRFKTLIENSREVKTTSKTLDISIAKEGILVDANENPIAEEMSFYEEEEG